MSEVNSYELTNILNYKLVNNSDLSKKYRNFFTYIYGNSCVLNTKITFIFFFIGSIHPNNGKFLCFGLLLYLMRYPE